MNYNKVDEVDTFSSIEKSRPTQHLPVNQSDLQYVRDFKQNIALDIKLGLESQAREGAKTLVDNDIDEILKGEPYAEVNIDDLEKLFSIPQMRRKSMLWNFTQKYKCSMLGMATAGTASNACWFLAHSSLFTFDNVASLLEVWTVVGCVALGIVTIIALIAGFMFMDDSKIPDHPKLVIDLEVENVKHTSMKIPYGAKLRMEEAFDTGKFDSFKISYPKPRIENVKRPAPKIVDPAIIGCKKNSLTGSEKWYMVVFWDIPKDKEITEKKIKELKRFKIVA